MFVQFLRNGWNFEPLKAGLLVSPVPFGAGVLAPIGGGVPDRVGYRPMMIVRIARSRTVHLYTADALGRVGCGHHPHRDRHRLLFVGAGGTVACPPTAAIVGVNHIVQRVMRWWATHRRMFVAASGRLVPSIASGSCRAAS